MQITTTHVAERFGQIEQFESYSDALRFVMREGDRSRLWRLFRVEGDVGVLVS